MHSTPAEWEETEEHSDLWQEIERPESSSESSDSENSDKEEQEDSGTEEVEDEEDSPTADSKRVPPTPSTWQKKQQDNRVSAAAKLPLMKSIFLSIQEGFHPGVACSTDDCKESKLLLRCLECSPTLWFCSGCWLQQHGSVRFQHVPEVYLDGWHFVTHFLKQKLPVTDESGATTFIDSFYPVCGASPPSSIPGLY